MQPSRIRELREKRLRIYEEARTLIPDAGQHWSSEDKKKFNVMQSEIEALGKEIRKAESEGESEVGALDAVERELRATRRPPESPISPFDEAIDYGAERRYSRAFTSFLRNGLLPDGRGSRGIGEEDRTLMAARGEYRDMGVGTGTLGGYFVPQGFVRDIDVALKFYGEMMQSSRILDTATGNILPYPSSNDTGVSGELVGEAQQVTDQDVVVGRVLFNAYKYSTKLVKVSLELLQDAAFDINDFLVEQFAIRLGRKLNADFTNGSGSNQPDGIVTAAVANNGAPQVWGAGSGPGIPLVAAGSSTNTGGAETGATSIGSDDLFNLEHSVDRLYRRRGAYMMNDLTLRYLKTIKDKYGRPLWVPGLKDNAPDTINGYPYFLNNDMAAIATGNVTVLFGDLKKYLIRRVKEMGVLRLTERFADYG